MKISPIQFNTNKDDVSDKKTSIVRHNYVCFSLRNDEVSFGNNFDLYRKKLQEEKMRKGLEAQQKFEMQSEIHPATAFMYNPELSLGQKSELIKKNSNIKSLTDISLDLGVSLDALRVFGKVQALEIEHPGTKYLESMQFVDVESEQNKTFFEMLREKLPNSLPAGKFMVMHNIKEDQFRKYLLNKEIVPLGTEFAVGLGLDNLIIDTLDTKNQELVIKLHKTRPVPSSQYIKSISTDGMHIPIMVPVTYLSTLGFGSPRDLANMVIEGKLPGNVEKTIKDGKVKHSVKVDIEPYIKSEEVLKDLRAQNPGVVEVHDLAKQIGVKLADVRYWMQNGDLKIINEYVFADDHDSVFINIQEPENKKFIETTLLKLEIERELEREQLSVQKAESSFEAKENRKKNDNETSLRMKIAWYLCPYTRSLLKSEAKGDKHLGLIIAKDENNEKLTSFEQQILNSYRKRVWDKRHAKDAFSNSINEAVAIMNQIKTQGLASISDPEIVKIVENHHAAYIEEQ